MMLNCFINPLMALVYETTHAQLGLQRVRVNFFKQFVRATQQSASTASRKSSCDTTV